MTKKTRVYGWAVINASGRIMREPNDRRAIYRTREQARMSARVLKGRAVRRSDVPAAVATQTVNQQLDQATLLARLATV